MELGYGLEIFDSESDLEIFYVHLYFELYRW